MEKITGHAMLIKFKCKDIIDSLQNGCIYMNSLKIFREIEKDTDDDKVGDWLDGLMHINDGYLIVEEPQFTVHPLKDVGIKTKYSEDFCYCFFGMNETNYQQSFTNVQKEKFSEMGDYALIILDYDEFMRRILRAIEGKGYEIYGGFVKYYDQNIDSFNVKQLVEKEGLKMIPMLKRKKYEYQQEFRIVIHAPNENKNHIKIEIGDISDITKKIESDALLEATIVPTSKAEITGDI